MIKQSLKTYDELISFPTFEERFRYLVLGGAVGAMTFGGHRLLNQDFYKSEEWMRVRREVIVRDNACDLAFDGRPIVGQVIVHHINPISIEDLEEDREIVLNPEFLICVSHRTHNALHYGDDRGIQRDYTPRCRNDTCPWK